MQISRLARSPTTASFKGLTMDNRSLQFVFVPFCTLAQAFHAQGLVRYEWGGAITPIIKLLLERDVNIIQMPCLETIHHGYEDGLKRQPKGKSYYDNDKFHALCREKAAEVVTQIEGLLSNGYTVAAILGMEYSPSCAVNVQYPPRKDQSPSGFFIQAVRKALEDADIEVPILGINRRGIGPTLERVSKLLDESMPDLFNKRPKG